MRRAEAGASPLPDLQISNLISCSSRLNLINLLLDLTLFGVGSYTAKSLHAIGQVAQLVERGPEKAGVGGSIPSLATIFFNVKICQNRLR